MTATFILCLSLLRHFGHHAYQENSRHWEFQTQLYGTEIIVIHNWTRWNPSQPKVYFYFDACLIQVNNPGWDTHDHFIGCEGLNGDESIKPTTNISVLSGAKKRATTRAKLVSCSTSDGMGLHLRVWGWSPNNLLAQLPSDSNYPQGACNPIKHAIKDPTHQEWTSCCWMSVWVNGGGESDPCTVMKIIKVWIPLPWIRIPTPKPSFSHWPLPAQLTTQDPQCLTSCVWSMVPTRSSKLYIQNWEITVGPVYPSQPSVIMP